MNMTGKITGIKYKPFLAEDLQTVDIKKFDINKMPSSCLLKDNEHTFAISKWVSPKRTRSYPYERVYNTLNASKKITVIPIIKDEGADGDRDFLQWDTVSLMSLLDVFVIFAYYNKAEKNPAYENKITNFQFDNKYVVSKIKEIEEYHSSALHWNLNELKNNFHNIIDKTKKSYAKIEKQTDVLLHSYKGIETFKDKIGQDVSAFMKFSREKAEKAQSREIVTIQPKESLSTSTKAKITITNYLGGQYFFTIDETLLLSNDIYLIEAKHSKNSLLPSISDIKDGLLKMILYSNLPKVAINGKKISSTGVLKLTSPKIKKYFASAIIPQYRQKIYKENGFSKNQIELIEKIVEEAKKNKFILEISKSND
ncbi:MAG: hypothetical protein LBQ31_07425 [Bacteroidales bacterium]|jgi:hypothetical protein|nr:hypothetical protein [Bacteroidales bacterium]